MTAFFQFYSEKCGLEKEGYRVNYLPVDREGLLKLADLEAAITDLISIPWLGPF